MINTSTATALAAGAAAGGIKLVFVGICLAVGFNVANTVWAGTLARLEARRYQKLEQQTDEPIIDLVEEVA